MTKDANSSSNHKLPLVSQMEEIERLANGSRIFRVKRRRGVLEEEFDISTELLTAPLYELQDPKQRLELLFSELREILMEAGLPTDQSRLEHRHLWIETVVTSTKSLTKERLAGELLDQGLALLEAIGGDTSLLRRLVKLLEVQRLFQTAKFNKIASSGAVAIESLAKGPSARKNTSRLVREIERRFARKYCSENPLYKDSTPDIAANIEAEVNSALSELGLKALRRATIEGHIRIMKKEGTLYESSPMLI